MAVKDDIVTKLTGMAQGLDSGLLREAVNEIISLRVRVTQLEAELATARAAAVVPETAPVAAVAEPAKSSKAAATGAAPMVASSPVQPAPAVAAKEPVIPSTCEISELPEGEDYILEISEVHMLDSGGSYDGGTFRVSTRKLRTWIEENDFAFGYVESIIKACLRGGQWTSSSRKYSFGDCADWYAPLEPDADAANDPVLRIECELG